MKRDAGKPLPIDWHVEEISHPVVVGAKMTVTLRPLTEAETLEVERVYGSAAARSLGFARRAVVSWSLPNHPDETAISMLPPAVVGEIALRVRRFNPKRKNGHPLVLARTS